MAKTIALLCLFCFVGVEAQREVGRTLQGIFDDCDDAEALGECYQDSSEELKGSSYFPTCGELQKVGQKIVHCWIRECPALKEHCDEINSWFEDLIDDYDSYYESLGYDGFPSCSFDDFQCTRIPGWAIFLSVFLPLLLVSICGILVYRRYRRNRLSQPQDNQTKQQGTQPSIPNAQPQYSGTAMPPQPMVETTVPAGVMPGQAFLVSFNNQQYEVHCPQGAYPGQKIQVSLTTPVNSNNVPIGVIVS